MRESTQKFKPTLKAAFLLALLVTPAMAHDLGGAGFSEKVAVLNLAPGAAGTLRDRDISVQIPRNAFSRAVKIELFRGERVGGSAFPAWKEAAPQNSDVLDAFVLVITDPATNKHIVAVPKLTYTLRDPRVKDGLQVWATGQAAPLKRVGQPIPITVKPGEVSFTLTDLTHGWLVTAPRAAVASAFSVDMQGMKFQPGTISVNVGESVRFVQKDDVPHNVVINDVMESPPSMKKGQVYTHTFSGPGTYRVYCEIHPTMTMTVTVK
ncbi:plastocyanin/azurin family copper-binding protein [Deinococcus hopiensis]|uniref:Plastocyanin n=1 Tax=Deinococcus hopiensis KR-140 TaxID=695939 RepID=A0A1W1VM75_9DEIO|nr:plastocyanin/azurin family copper-binding protein [Deinococcus hopiensis]SMB94479.1 Plastocyanin [Deinococcus hopiensis KR-140]